MLSILIPSYNNNTKKLSFDLHRQIEQFSTPIEIIVIEDGSKDKETIAGNKDIMNLTNCTYFYREQNSGRAQIRNILAQKAKYDFILFIDGDSLVSDNFIRNYLKAMDENSEVIYGGRVHPKEYQKNNILRWKYGIKVEDKKAEKRIPKPYQSLVFNNTIILKSLFLKTGFTESLTKYGHEDTLLAFQLKKLGVNISHIDNPIIHGEVDKSDVFISKTLSGLENLKVLFNEKKIDTDFVKILSVYYTLKSLHLDNFFSWFFSTFQNNMKKNLLSIHPSLFVFNLFKISYFCKINKK